MRIDRIEFENFRCFEKQAFDLAPRFNLVVGDNATGKTSLLNGLASILASLCPVDASISGKEPVSETDFRMVSHTKMRSIERMPILGINAAVLIDDVVQKVSINELGPRHWPGAQLALTPLNDRRSRLEARVARGDSVLLYAATFYSTGRRGQLVKEELAHAPGSRFRGYDSALSPESKFKLLLPWFKYSEFVHLQKRKKLPDLESVRGAITTCVPGAVDAYWDVELDQLIIQLDKSSIEFNKLSDGFRGVLSMIADIALRCALLNPILESKAALETPGVVLIDELDLHLHPKWQRHIVSDLMKAFPRIQFVATTHSPFIIQSLPPVEGVQLINLDKPEENDFANKSVEDIAEVIQGVEMPQQSQRYQEMKKAAEEYYKVLGEAKGKTNGELPKLKARLDELTEPYSDDPAYRAFLNMQRIVSGIDKVPENATR